MLLLTTACAERNCLPKSNCGISLTSTFGFHQFLNSEGKKREGLMEKEAVTRDYIKKKFVYERLFDQLQLIVSSVI